MHYACPSTLKEALEILGNDEDARCLAGGATLMAMLNAQLMTPSTLVSLRNINELNGIARTAAGFRIGAMTRHHVVASSAMINGGLAVVRLAAQEIGHPAIRAIGTIGGSVAHADPAADYPTALVAADADIEICSATGQRTVPADQFFEDYFTTALQPGEIVCAISLKRDPEIEVSSYTKVARSDGDFATVSLAFCGSFEGDTCTRARIVVGGCGSTPVHVPLVDQMLVGTQIGSAEIANAADALALACDPIDDVRGSAAYRRLLVTRLLGPALEKAKAMKKD
ncbi:MAG: xanthine dehydrogenase family protein subunit M [Proteobacteria bacterium]|nr:xanthine dehydrogenase family protein subunit M [Pseudomonadota bacterium]